jgi:predicted ATPase
MKGRNLVFFFWANAAVISFNMTQLCKAKVSVRDFLEVEKEIFMFELRLRNFFLV